MPGLFDDAHAGEEARFEPREGFGLDQASHLALFEAEGSGSGGQVAVEDHELCDQLGTALVFEGGVYVFDVGHGQWLLSRGGEVVWRPLLSGVTV